jgi:hypothetical protein
MKRSAIVGIASSAILGATSYLSARAGYNAEIPAIPELIGVGAQHRAVKPSANASDKEKGAIAEIVAKYKALAPKQRLPN